MINRANRFHGQKAISYVLKTGQSVRANQLVLKYLVNQHRSDYRAAVVVSRKVSKSAVVRNRIRRRLYEELRRQAGQFHYSYDMVWLVYDEQLATKPPAEVSRVVSSLMGRAKIIKSAGRQQANQTTGRAIVKNKENGK